ncbi:DUF4230 domain-containing protein [Bacillus sp. B1-b2]|uniref:DUF4230 domain-containing protein n=1 Tax=Bacillus sp. B1-b2 TaxID=2653201 RepID=UPI001261714E|nr:DUF4230 domain-containing protein [Bacillus sp. B1-b2]KAB7670632.1 DUF4230 domain-containing protein [Bacillus sp. B1-b2]
MVTRKERKTIEREINQGEKEQASTAVELNSREIRFPSFGLNKRKRKLSRKITITLVFIILLLAIGIISLWQVAFPKEPVMRTSAYLEQMKDLSTLASSQAYIKVILEKEDNELFGKEINTNIPGTKRKILLVVPGTVTAGVDLSSMKNNQIEVDEETKTLNITLPKASFLQDPSVNFDQVETYSISGIFRSDVEWEEAYDLMEEAKLAIEEEATAQGLLEKAEENAEKTIKEFYQQLGYSVNLSYETQ